MDELFQSLERKIKELLSQHANLKSTNQQLSHKKNSLANEKAHLLATHQKAITKIETLLSHLKTLEKTS